MEWDVSLSPPATSASESDGPLYASVDGLVAPLSNEECVFQHRDSGETHVMTVDVLAAMDACRRFRPLEEHIGIVEQKLPALKGNREAISKVLGFLIHRGLMVSDADLTRRLRSIASKDLDAPVALAVRTCDRPDQLERLLESLKDYEGRFSRGLRYVIVDDSREPESVNRNAAAAAALHASGIRCHHLDRDWRERLAGWCARESRIGDQASFLLGMVRSDQFTGGAVGNASLLLTAGSRMLMLDDDFILDPKQRSTAGRGLGVREPRHIPMSFEPGMEQLANSLETFEGDPLADHIRACGQPAACLLSTDFGLSLGSETFRDASFRVGRGLLRCEAIKTTAGGVWGDSRMDTTLWYYVIPGRYSRSIWSDDARYRSLMHRPIMAHGFDQLQLASLSNFTPVCVDNSELTPCVPPSGRGEDYAFAAWMRYLYPDSLTLHIPSMLRHERPAGSGESPHAHAFVPWFSRFAGEYALSHLDECQAQNPDQRIATLTALYRDLAAASIERRTRVLREFLAYMRAQIVQQLQQSLVALEEPPDYWLQDSREWIKANGQALTDAGPPRLRDWPQDLDAAGCAGALARDLGRCADALDAWPALWNQCRGRFEELLEL